MAIAVHDHRQRPGQRLQLRQGQRRAGIAAPKIGRDRGGIVLRDQEIARQFAGSRKAGEVAAA